MKNRKATLVVLAAAVGALMASSPLLRTDGAIALGALVLLALCVLPFVLWIKRGMHGMPLFEMFAAMHLVYYWMPAGRELARSDSADGVNAQAIWVVCLFLGAGAVAHYGIMAWVARRRGLRWAWMDGRVSDFNRASWAWAMLVGALAFEMLVQTGLIWHLLDWSAYRPVQTIFSAFAMLGTFGLAVRFGGGKLTKVQGSVFLAILGLLLGLYAVSGFLGAAGTTALVAGFGYMLSSKRVPIVAFVVCLAVGSFLNLGKREWRYKYWDAEGNAGITARAEDLVMYAVKALGERLSTRATDDQFSATLLERATLIEVLHRTAALTPQTIPYWGGQTYSYGISLLVPRWLNPGRGDIHQAMTEVGMTYGFFQTLDAATNTNVSIGPIAEAWISGGWLVVALAGGSFGAFFALGAGMAWGRPFESVGYLSGVFFFSQLVITMELFAGSTLMAFTRNYLIALMTLLTLVFLQRLGRSQPALAQKGSTRLAPRAS